MLRIEDARDVPNVKPHRISIEPGPGMSPAIAEIRIAVIKQIKNLKAAPLNGCLLDLIDEIDLREARKPVVGHVLKIKGVLPIYESQYLELNFQPEFDERFYLMWRERNLYMQHKRRHEDKIKIEQLKEGVWTVRLQAEFAN